MRPNSDSFVESGASERLHGADGLRSNRLGVSSDRIVDESAQGSWMVQGRMTLQSANGLGLPMAKRVPVSLIVHAEPFD